VTFTELFVPSALRAAVSDEAWLEAMLDAERALANAEALAGVISAADAASIAEACRPELYDVAALAEAGRAVGNPAEPLVRALREQVGGDAARAVHRGATSQDVLDTAAMLVARRALAIVLEELDTVADLCARLAVTHRLTPMPARTLLQQAVPTTFGLKAAGWLCGAIAASDELRQVEADGLAAQLGGAAGTLAALGDQGIAVVSLYAAELELPEPLLPWHTERGRVARLGAALAIAAGTLSKIALDVILLAQSEVGEVSEASGGGSSAMPQKRNPAGSVRVRACARAAAAQAWLLVGTLEQEHERAAGAWQAEWSALSGALAATGGAATALRQVLAGLRVHDERMRANLEASGGAIMAERLSVELGADEAARLARHAAAGGSLREELLRTRSAEDVDRVLDPAGYLGAAGTLVDRALSLHAERRKP
jgi:3-carboxy-cis,cis-muconate cycloisomerase